MKQFLILWFALFPYFHSQRYTVNFHSCEAERIIVEDGKEPFAITLFNLKISDEKGWERTCTMLQEAEKLEIEVDPSSQISEPLPVYLFADGELLQKTLVRENHAYTLIHNPEYLYEEELLALEESTSTMAMTEGTQENHNAHSNGWLFLFFIFCSWLITIFMTVRSFQKQSVKQPHLPR